MNTTTEINQPPVTPFMKAQVRAFLTDMTCGENCWSAKEDICRCECGGKNHGIHLRGENAVRACKIDGRRYELLAVGNHKDLCNQVEKLIIDADLASGERRMLNGTLQAKSYRGDWFNNSYVHPSSYQGKGSQYVLKYASMPQCLKWRELEHYQISDDRMRYRANIGMLWIRKDISN